MNALILVTVIIVSALASPSPSNAGPGKNAKITRSVMVPQPPKIIANQTRTGTGKLTQCKKNAKKCVKSNGKFVTP